MTATLTVVAEVVVVIALILVRQLSTRRIKDNPLKVPLVLGAIGVVNVANFVGGHRITPGATAGVLAGLVVAAVVAWPRAHSMKVWREPDGTWLRKGTAATVCWWVVAIVGHVTTAYVGPLVFGEKPHGFGGFDSATLLIYLAVSLGAQAWFLEERLHRTFPGERPTTLPLAR